MGIYSPSERATISGSAGTCHVCGSNTARRFSREDRHGEIWIVWACGQDCARKFFIGN